MTYLVRVINDTHEAEDAREAAYFEFIRNLEAKDRKHLVTDAAIDRWYSPHVRRNYAQRTAKYGSPTSARLDQA